MFYKHVVSRNQCQNNKTFTAKPLSQDILGRLISYPDCRQLNKLTLPLIRAIMNSGREQPDIIKYRQPSYYLVRRFVLNT